MPLVGPNSFGHLFFSGKGVIGSLPCMRNWPDIALIVLLFIATWVAVVNIISLLGGWRSLGKSYRADRPFSGQRFWFQSAGLRTMTSYNNVLTIGANEEGLYLSVFFLFRFGHPPLFIPWEDISGTPKRVLWMKTVKLQFQKCPSVPVSISKRLADKLERASGVQFIADKDPNN